LKKFFLILIALSTTLLTKNYGGYKKLMPLKDYSPYSYKLSKDIKYLELRLYTYSNGQELTKRGTVSKNLRASLAFLYALLLFFDLALARTSKECLA